MRKTQGYFYFTLNFGGSFHEARLFTLSLFPSLGHKKWRISYF